MLPFTSDNTHFYGATAQDIIDSKLELDPSALAVDILDFLSMNPNVTADGEVHDNTIIITSLAGTTKNFEQTSRFRQLFSSFVNHFYMKGKSVSASEFNHDKIHSKHIVLFGGPYHGRTFSILTHVDHIDVVPPLTPATLESVFLLGVAKYSKLPFTYWNFREVFAIVQPIGFSPLAQENPAS